MRRGFTLIEVIIYVAMISLFMTALVTFAVNVMLARAKNNSISDINQEARHILRRMETAIVNSKYILSPATSTAAAFFQLRMASSTLNPTSFEVSNGAVAIKEGNGATTTLTSSRVTFDAPYFYNLSVNTTPTLRLQFRSGLTDPNNSSDFIYAVYWDTSVTARKN
ncbi:MAG: hypothetical protein HW383_27 [Candidatus Magasanikbacteria bacterium]|nr:hypothetical protein [Candidatus Magasanikbacteria bacterium]